MLWFILYMHGPILIYNPRQNTVFRPMFVAYILFCHLQVSWLLYKSIESVFDSLRVINNPSDDSGYLDRTVCDIYCMFI